MTVCDIPERFAKIEAPIKAPPPNPPPKYVQGTRGLARRRAPAAQRPGPPCIRSRRSRRAAVRRWSRRRRTESRDCRTPPARSPCCSGGPSGTIRRMVETLTVRSAKGTRRGTGRKTKKDSHYKIQGDRLAWRRVKYYIYGDLNVPNLAITHDSRLCSKGEAKKNYIK